MLKREGLVLSDQSLLTIISPPLVTENVSISVNGSMNDVSVSDDSGVAIYSSILLARC